MAHPRESTDLMERIAKSVRDCGTWRAAGLSEKYLEAYSLMKALEAELEALGATPEALRSSVGPAASPPVANTSGERAQYRLPAR